MANFTLACSHSTHQRQVPCQRLLVPKAPTLSQQLRTCENQVNALSSKTLSPPLPCCLKPPYIPCLVLKYLLTLEANLLVYHVPCYNCAIAPLPGKETTSHSSLSWGCWGSKLKSHCSIWDPRYHFHLHSLAALGPGNERWRMCKIN